MKRTYVQGLMVLFISVTLPAVALADKVIGSLAVVKGKVEIKDAKGKIANARVGSKVKEKDTILTGADSRAKLVMVDENVLNISPDSQINLESYKFEPDKNEKNVSINVLYGKVRSTVNQKYEGENKFHVKTPAAVAGVRGTDFLAGFNSLKKESQFVTFEGKVEVGQAGPGGSIVNAVMVNPGQTTTTVAGAPPAPPKALPKSEMASINKESTADGTGNSDRREPAATTEKKEEKKEEAKKEEPKKEEPKKEEAKKEEGKKQEPAAKKDASGDSKKETASSEGKKEPAAGDTKKEPARSEAKENRGTPTAKSDGGNEGKSNPGPAPSGESKPANGPPVASSPAAKDGMSGAPMPTGDRAPASTGMAPPGPSAGGLPPMPGGMIDKTDLPMMNGTTPSFNTPTAGSIAINPVPIVIQPTQALPTIPVCQFCNDAIANGKSRVIINVNGP